MEEAEGDRLEDARNILAEALRALERIVNPMVDMLRRELQRLLELFRTKDTYRKQGRPYAISSLASHGRQRFTARGDAEDVRLFATRRMDTYLEQAKRPDEKPPTADEDVREEAEPERAVPQDGDRWTVTSVALRLLATVLSLLAFSIMASARTSGWDGDRYGRYEPYRYAVGVNVVVCICSISQVIVELRRLHRSAAPPSTSIYCIHLFLDQVLAYLLMSAASAAASRNHLWAARFGEDQFCRKISVVVWLSFLGFLALSANALIALANFFGRIDMPAN
ncbi:hypothetical protein PVAP13_8NG239501 [Panicum virgatum]|uniref:CASP-like protein n=1 Tax=Panicum virgatum TaxID=38727 RepID=A0A8T0P993_PANVG|nr:hypothetical protein PVAP13_8NG239501 [Panicum virgatum]